jgi:alpha-beta hydrolase superfamily lysophospholipase
MGKTRSGESNREGAVVAKRASAIVATLCLLWAALLASSGAVEARPEWTRFYTASAFDIALPPGTLLDYERIRLPAFYRAKAWRILYSTRDFRGRPIASSGLVILSDYAPKNPSDRNIVAWAHPTVGIARQCAPSLRKGPTSAILGLNDLVTGGYIVTATDYPGLGTSGPIGYLIGKGQAQAVIDSARAARQIPEVGGSNRYALWGYSQGGHAALFAAQMSAAYAPEFKLVGVAATAPPTDLGRLLIADLNTLEGRILSSFTLGSWAKKYGLGLDDLMDRDTVGFMQKLNANCIDDLSGMLDALSAQKPLSERFLTQNPLVLPPWRAAISENSLYSLSTATPAIILQGQADRIVHPSITQKFVSASCRNGAVVKYVVLKDKSHGGSAKDSVGSALSWINDRFRGGPVPNSCRLANY